LRRRQEHWKRSLAIVAMVLVAVGLAASAAGGSFVDDFKASRSPETAGRSGANRGSPAGTSGNASGSAYAT
jgi:hypothetical protein